jgi:hypothetical protein
LKIPLYLESLFFFLLDLKWINILNPSLHEKLALSLKGDAIAYSQTIGVDG